MNLTGRNRVAPGDDNVLIWVSGTGLSRFMILSAALGAMVATSLSALLADSSHPYRLVVALVRLSLTRNPSQGTTEQES